MAGLHRTWSRADKPACIDCRRASAARATSSSRRRCGTTRSGSHAAARGAGLQYLVPNPAPMHRSIRERVCLQYQAAGRFHALQAPAAHLVHLPRPRYTFGSTYKINVALLWAAPGPELGRSGSRANGSCGECRIQAGQPPADTACAGIGRCVSIRNRVHAALTRPRTYLIPLFYH